MSKKPTPSKKQCPSSTGSRSSKWAYNLRRKWNNKIQMVKCTNCGAMKRNHFVCDTCGYYGGKMMMKTKAMKAAASIRTIEA